VNQGAPSRRRFLQVHSVLHCLYEVLLYAEGEDAIMYAEAAHLAAMMVDESAMQLDSMSIKPLIDALNANGDGCNPMHGCCVISVHDAFHTSRARPRTFRTFT
jgi:hypothetical protein